MFSSGFQINEHGTKAMSMGGAFAALANDPSAIYFNPAGITQLFGTNIIGGTTLILPNSSFRGPSPATAEYNLEPKIFYPIHLYATHQVNEKLFFGFGVGNNFGLGTKWDNNWIGKYMAVDTEIRTFVFNLVTSYQIIPEISIGFGYIISYGDVTIGRSQNLQPFGDDAYIELNGDGISSGFSTGVLFHATRALSIGISYRSQLNFEFKGNAEPKKYPMPLEALLPKGKISAPLTTPENITLGIALRPLKYFRLTADYQFVGWDSYDKLEIQFEKFVDSKTNDLLVTSSERNYENTFIARVGAEYNYSKRVDLYAGFLYDKNPIKDEYLDPTLPDADRMGFSFGFAYKFSKMLSVEMGYLFLRFDERKITNSLQNYSGIANSISPMNGIYNSSAHLTSITFSYKL
jgi:long-chain fatty acid transport protein